MWLIAPRWIITLCICLALAVALSTTSAVAQQPTKVAGMITAAYTEQDSIVVGDDPGHLLSLAVSAGKNVSKGENVFMDAAEAVNMSQTDLVKGNGTQQGYVRFTKDGDTVFAKWNGKVTTTMTKDGTRVTNFEGTFSYVKGTGQFENIQGSGTYLGSFTREGQYAVEWQGEYRIAE